MFTMRKSDDYKFWKKKYDELQLEYDRQRVDFVRMFSVNEALSKSVVLLKQRNAAMEEALVDLSEANNKLQYVDADKKF